MSTPQSTLHPELLVSDHPDAIVQNGTCLDYADGASKALRPPPEPQPLGARIYGNRPIDWTEAATCFIEAPAHEKMHDKRLWDLRHSATVRRTRFPKWTSFRLLASSIKERILAYLHKYLKQFETNARSNGVHVHWASDAAKHNRIVHGMLGDHGARSLIESKSMLTEECRLPHYMASVKPVLEVLHKWADTQHRRLSRTSPLARAFQYSLSRWDALPRYVENGRPRIGNNRAERLLRGKIFCSSAPIEAVIGQLPSTPSLTSASSTDWIQKPISLASSTDWHTIILSTASQNFCPGTINYQSTPRNGQLRRSADAYQSPLDPSRSRVARAPVSCSCSQVIDVYLGVDGSNNDTMLEHHASEMI